MSYCIIFAAEKKNFSSSCNPFVFFRLTDRTSEELDKNDKEKLGGTGIIWM